MEGSVAPIRDQPMDGQNIGTRLRHARLSAALQMRELAEAAGCSESYISKIESGKVLPSLAMLHRLASALGLNMTAFFNNVVDESPVRVVRSGTGPRITTRTPRKGPGIEIEGLVVPSRSGLLQVNIHHVDLGGESEGVISHKGEEFGIVLRGRLSLTVDGRVYELEQGDSFSFSSELPHSYKNVGTSQLSVLWINTPPTF